MQYSIYLNVFDFFFIICEIFIFDMLFTIFSG